MEYYTAIKGMNLSHLLVFICISNKFQRTRISCVRYMIASMANNMDNGYNMDTCSVE